MRIIVGCWVLVITCSCGVSQGGAEPHGICNILPLAPDASLPTAIQRLPIELAIVEVSEEVCLLHNTGLALPPLPCTGNGNLSGEREKIYMEACLGYVVLLFASFPTPSPCRWLGRGCTR